MNTVQSLDDLDLAGTLLSHSGITRIADLIDLRLSGSRYFANEYPNVITVNEFTDWDYYVQFSPEVMDTLMEFKSKGELFSLTEAQANYTDNLAVSIFFGSDFQIVVRSDAALYQKVIERISPEFYRDYLWKSSQNGPNREQIQRIFNQLFEMAK